jgi:ankyrin repeat protein
MSDVGRGKTKVSMDDALTVASSLRGSDKSNVATTNKLLNHLTEGNWDGALDRLTRKPGDIHERFLFLHEALQNKAPLNVVQALYTARPDAVYHQEHSNGMTALHVACERGMPVDAVQYLHEKYPEAATRTCRGGMLPLHLASISNACMTPVISYLLSVYPEGASVKDEKEMTALDYIEHSFHPHQQILYREFERGVSFWSAKELKDPKGCPLSLLICERKWDEALERLLKYPEEATIWSNYKSLRYLPIHYACKYKAPLNVVTELAELHPFGLSLTCQEYDMTALHLACQHGANLEILKILIQGHADAASHKDDLGLLPLHLACAQGTSRVVVETLLGAYPEAVSTLDANGYTPRVYVEASSHPHSKFVLELLTE